VSPTTVAPTTDETRKPAAYVVPAALSGTTMIAIANEAMPAPAPPIRGRRTASRCADGSPDPDGRGRHDGEPDHHERRHHELVLHDRHPARHRSAREGLRRDPHVLTTPSARTRREQWVTLHHMDDVEGMERLARARVARLATVRPDGRPHVVPLVFALVDHVDGPVAYWAVDGKPKAGPTLQRITNLEANPAAELLADGYEEDWSRLWWVRASVTGREVLDPDERSQALEALAEKYPQYRADPPQGRIFCLEVTDVRGWSGGC
jgi:PPOX class probable F420-dependent enzyme